MITWNCSINMNVNVMIKINRVKEPFGENHIYRIVYTKSLKWHTNYASN